MNATAQWRGSDLARQIVVLSAVSFMLIAAVIGAGAFGNTAVQDQQGGALNTDGSYLAPAGPAFSIWSVIYLGLIVYSIWQALPRQRTNPRQRALGWLIALTMTLNGLWLVAARFGTLVLTVVVIVLLLAALGWTFRSPSPRASRAAVSSTPCSSTASRACTSAGSPWRPSPTPPRG